MTSTTPRPLRLGVVGYGQAAAGIVGSLVRSGRMSIVGGADPDPRARAKFEQASGAPTCESMSQLCEAYDPEALYIATPTRLREEHVLAAFAAGQHVLVEKPLAPTVAAGERMIEAAKASSRVLMVCHKRSVDAPILAMWQTLRRGDLGQVRLVHRWHLSDWFYRPRLPDEIVPPFGGSVIRQGSHEFDIIRFLAGGKATRVKGWVGDYDPTRPGEGAYQAWVDFEQGAVGMSFFSGYDHLHDEELSGEITEPALVGATQRQFVAEMAAGRNQGDLKRDFQVIGGGNRGFTLVSCEGGDMRPMPDGGVWIYGPEGRRESHAVGPTGGAFVAEELYGAVTGGHPVLHDGNWGLSNLEVCLAVRTSAEHGGSVDLDHQVEVDADVACELSGM